MTTKEKIKLMFDLVQKYNYPVNNFDYLCPYYFNFYRMNGNNLSWTLEVLCIMSNYGYDVHSQIKLIENLRKLLSDDQDLAEFIDIYGLCFFDPYKKNCLDMQNYKGCENPFLITLKNYYNMTASEFLTYLYTYDRTV